MDIFELVEEFLKSNGLKWVDKQVYTSEIKDKMYVKRTIKKEDIEDFKLVTIPVEILEIADKYKIVFKLDISVDLLHFEVYGINMILPTCFALKEEYEELLKPRTLDKQWQRFFYSKKGLVYRTAVREESIQKMSLISCETQQKVREILKQIKRVKNEARLDIRAIEQDYKYFEETIDENI